MDDVRDVASELVHEFGDRTTPSAVTRVVDDARADLEGQVTDGAFAELVHRLAHTRLAELTGSSA